MDAAAVGDFSFLDGVSPSRYGDALKAGPAVPWILALRLEGEGSLERAVGMYAVGAGAKLPKPGDPAFAPAVLYRWESLKSLARLAYGDARLTALDELLAMAANRDIRGLTELSGIDFDALSGEYADARAVTLIELGRGAELPGGIASWLDSRPLTSDTLRALETLDEGALDARTRGELEWRAAVFARDYQRSWLIAEAWIGEYGLPSGRYPLSELGRAAVYGAADATAPDSGLSARFEGMSSQFTGDERYVSLFYAARLAYRSGADGEGDRLMALARDAAASPADRDSASWYILDSANRRGADAALVGSDVVL